MTSVAANKTKGILLSLLAIPAAIIVWVIVWSMGFIASIVALGLAYAVVWLYAKGAGAQPDKTVALPLVLVILVGCVLSFVAGVAYEGYSYYQSEEYLADAKVETNPTPDETAEYVASMMGDSSLWEAYTNDIIMTIVFTLLGAGGVVYSLFKGQEVAPSPGKKR